MSRLTLIAALLVASACDADPGIDCTAEARASVQVTVVDDVGANIAGATGTWSVDGQTPVDCDGMGNELVCGWEAEGDLTIRVEAEGYEPAERIVTVTSDECHVQTEHVEIELAAAAE